MSDIAELESLAQMCYNMRVQAIEVRPELVGYQLNMVSFQRPVEPISLLLLGHNRRLSGRRDVSFWGRSMSIASIYKITCQVNSTVYIGSTIDWQRRKAEHFARLANGTHDNEYMQNACDKYGLSNFNFVVLEYVRDIDLLHEREAKWLEYYRGRGVVFNVMDPIPNGPMPDGVKKKISQAHKGKVVDPVVVQRTANKLAQAYPAFENVMTGETIPAGKNLKQLCRNRGLSQSQMWKIVKGMGYTHKGWKIKGIKLPEHHNARDYPAFRHKKTGEVIPAGTNLSDLCRSRGLDISAMCHVINKKVRQHQGWERLDKAGWSDEGRSPETKRRQSESLMGHSVSQETRRKIAHKNSKSYPAFQHKETGEVIPGGVNLAKMCREHNLDPSAMSRVVRGKSVSHKGWGLNSDYL